MKSLKIKNSMPEAVSDSGHHPSVTIDHKNMPELKKLKVGAKGHMKVRFQVAGQNAYRNGDSHSNLDLTHAEMIDDNSAEEKAESKQQEAAENETK